MSNNVIPFGKSKTETETAIVIPARLGSTRFPEKMLKKVNHKETLIEYVFRKCQLAHNTTDVFVATDSKKIYDLFPGKAIMTDANCENGTARIASVIDQLHGYDYIINVQGDMIEFPEHLVKDIRMLLLDGEDVVTVCKAMEQEDRHDPNTVKCINNGMYAHWFCRASIEYGDWHLGIYGYSKPSLAAYPYMNSYEEEDLESLEQLRWLQNNVKVSITYTDGNAAEINTPGDLISWQQTPLS